MPNTGLQPVSIINSTRIITDDAGTVVYSEALSIHSCGTYMLIVPTIQSLILTRMGEE
ncbi:MAG: hypothetical protein MUF15_20905 [Acidobacteria bacterium]|nr:hypothetical protein [Acidobacteriota bacterium]